MVSQDTELKKLQEKIKKKGKIIMIPDKEPVNTWSGNSSNMTFDFDFLINSEDELLVLHTNKAGVQTALKLNIDYTIHQTGNADGSYIIFPILGSSYKTLGEGEKITLMLDIPIAQNSPYGTSDKLNLKSLEFSLDYIVRLIQMVNRKAERSVKVQEGSSVTPDDLIESLNQAQINANNSAQQAAASASSASYYAVTAAEEAAVAAQKTAEISEIAEELEALDFADPDLSNITNAGKQVIRLNGGSFVPFCVNSGAITDGTESLLSEANNTITAQAPFTITSASGITKKITENLSLDVSTCEPGQYEVMFDFDTSSLFLFSGTIHTGKKFPENAQTGDILFDISCAPYSSRKLLDDGTVKIECARIGLYDCVSGGGG